MAKAPAKTPTAKKTVAKKPAATKKASTAKKPATAKAAVKKPAATKAAKPRSIGAEERYKMIEVAAYYIAERSNFRGSTLDFWIAAEAEISAKVGK